MLLGKRSNTRRRWIQICCWGLFALGSVSGQAELVTNLTHVNTPNSEISPALYGNELVYVHQPPNGILDPATNTIFYELYRAGQRPSRKRPKPFSVELNSSYHEGAATFSRDLKQIFFTRTNMRQGVTQAGTRGKAGLKIYYAFQGPYEWTGLRELPFNGDDFSCMHPTLSADGNRLYFTSDRPGGFGGYDIYMSEWRNGQWGEPINLGPDVNTNKNEAYPFIHENGHLFFASNRLTSNGLDIFTIDLSGRKWGQVYRLPPPYNSEADDFGFVLESSEASGYFTSNRPGGVGKDDIYRFSAPAGMESFTGHSVRSELVTVYDGADSRRLFGAEILLSELPRPGSDPIGPEIVAGGDGNFRLRPGKSAYAGEERRFATDAEGGADLMLKEGTSYRLLVFKSGFAPGEMRFSYGPNGPSRPLEMVLQPANCMLIAGKITDDRSGKGINGVQLTFNPSDCELSSVTAQTDQDGKYFACVPKGCNYELEARHPGYTEARSGIGTVRSRTERLAVDLQLSSVGNSTPAITLTPGAVILMEELEYEDDLFVPASGQHQELNLLAALLLTNQGMTVALENHTETDGPAVYRRDLSEKRVASIRDFLVSRGVDQGRLQFTAHGAAVPRNGCNGRQNCTPEEHRKNRRTEVKILSLGVR